MKKKQMIFTALLFLILGVMTGCGKDNSTTEYNVIGETQNGTEIFTEAFWEDVTEIVYFESNIEYKVSTEETLEEIYDVLTSMNYTEIENPMLEGGYSFNLYTGDEAQTLWISSDVIGYDGKSYQISYDHIGKRIRYLAKTTDGLKINIDEKSSGKYSITIADQGYSENLPVYMNIQFSTDADGKIVQDSKEVNYETDKNEIYESVNVYLNDEATHDKYVWITIHNVEFYSDSGEFQKRVDFEYELQFRFNTEALEAFDVKKNGENMNAPTEDEVLEMRENVTKGMPEEEIDRITENIKVANLALENAYLNDNLFKKLSDPENLYWNYIDEKGDIQIGWAGEENDTPVMAYNRFDAENFITLMDEMKNSLKTELLKQDFDNLIENMRLAKETHDVKYVEEIYHILHDMDYFLFRYGIKDVGAYVQDKSTVSKYYGALEVY